jgi:hypothetical protein
MIGMRVALVCAVFLAGCASSSYYTVKRVDEAGGCQTTVPARDLLLGVALSGGGSRAALFAEAGLEALAGLRTADGVSVIDKISHLSSVSGGSLSATYYMLKKPGRDVPVLNADGSLSEAYRERRLLRRSLPFSLLNFDFTRIPSIMEERAITYQALFFRTLQIEGVFPDSKTFTVIVLRHTAAKWAVDMSDLPPTCKAELQPLKTPEEVVNRIAEIPTRLGLSSECDRQLIHAAATKLVSEHRDEILEYLNRP